MKALEQEVRALLHAAQQEREAAQDRGRVDTTFQVGDQVMLRTKELLDAAEVGKLRPRWEGPFPVAAVAGPNTYTLTLPARFKCSPTVNVDRFKPYFLSLPSDGPALSSGPVTDPGPAGEYVVEQLLNRKTVHGRTYYLVRWQGHASAADSWEPAEHLTNCQERVAEYEATAPRHPKALWAQQHACTAPLAQAAAPPAPPPSPVRPQPRPDGLWRPRTHQPSAPPCSIGGRTRAGSSGASGAAAGVPPSPTSSATDADRRLRGRGRHAPRSGHLRLWLGLADPGHPLLLSRRRNGTTVSVPARSDPAGWIGC